jgi:aminoglycoside phosphotransferase (APT) family kinase protein
LSDEERRSGFRRLGVSQNEVLEIGGQGLLHDTFIFKRSKKSADSLQKEWQMTQFLYNIFGQRDSVVQPLAFIEKEGESYLVLRRIPGKPLATNEDPSIWDQAIDFTAEFHDRLRQPDAKEKFPFEDKFDNHRALRAYAKRVVKDEYEREKIVATTLFLADYLSQKRQQPIHGDFHSENIFICGDGFTVLDLERMTCGDVKSDLVDLIEGRLVPARFAASDRERWRRRYYEAEKKKASYDLFQLDYAYAAVARLLKTIGTLTERSYGFSPAESQKIREEYTTKARAQLQIIVQLDERKREHVKVLEERLVA